MNVQLITGPAGSGKTTNAIEEFAGLLKADPAGAVTSLRYVVPTTRIARLVEKQIMEIAGLSGIMGNVVCTFYGLAEEIIAQFGRSGSMISDVQRTILLGDLVTSAKLSSLGRSAVYPGFVKALGQIIGELKISLVSPDDLEQLVSSAPGKVAELADLYRRYQQDVLVKHSLHDREGLMGRALEYLSAMGDSGLKTVVFDGFGELNGVQREFIRKIAASAERVTVLLDYEADRPEVFKTAEPTRKFVLSLGASEMAVMRAESRGPVLRHVEQSVFSGSAKMIASDGAVGIIEGGSPYIEVEMIAEEIRRLVRDRGYSFGEIALVGRDVASYRARVERVFPEFDIPVDTGNKPLSGAAMARTLGACLSAMRTGWQRTDVIRLLKSEYLSEDEDAVRKACLVDVSAKKIALFEGRTRWLSKWAEDDDFLDFRTETLQPLADFEDALKNSAGTMGRTAAVGELVKRFQQRKDDGAMQAEDSAATHAISQILDDLVTADRLLGKDQDRADFMDLLQMSIAAASVPAVRAASDVVSLISTNALGGQRFRAVFVTGLLEKVFPRQVSEDSFLRDRERAFLNSSADRVCLSLASDRQDAERLAFYSAVSCATERLYLCYPLADEAAKDSLPSFYVDEIRKLFSGSIPTAKRDVSDLVPPVAQAECPAELRRSFIYFLANPVNSSLAEQAGLYRCFSDEDAKLIAESALGSQEKPASLTQSTVLKHLTEDGKSYTCTELEAYAACPFMHFCGHTLRLDSVQEDVGPMDFGSLLHNALCAVFTHFRKRAGRPIALTELDIGDVLHVASQLFNDQFKDNRRLMNLPKYEIEIVKRSLWLCLKRYLRAEYRNPYPGFVPEFFELQFGKSSRKDRDFDDKSTEQRLAVETGDGPPVRIVGKMDRLDTSEAGAMIIDYKLGSGTDITGFEKGLVLQAMIYALAVRDIFGLNPVGTEYRTLKKWDPKGYYVGETGPKNRTFTPEEFDEKLEQCKDYVREIAKGIRCGAIAVEPKLCKDYCGFKSVCRIDVHKRLKLNEAEGVESAEETPE